MYLQIFNSFKKSKILSSNLKISVSNRLHDAIVWQLAQVDFRVGQRTFAIQLVDLLFDLVDLARVASIPAPLFSQDFFFFWQFWKNLPIFVNLASKANSCLVVFGWFGGIGPFWKRSWSRFSRAFLVFYKNLRFKTRKKQIKPLAVKRPSSCPFLFR